MSLCPWLSAQKDGKIQIYREGKKYFGRIIWGTGGPELDEKNPDPALRSRRLIGTVILKDFVFDDDDTWNGGTIYDPREGKTYSCKMTLKDANRLSIRGYVGISLFGTDGFCVNRLSFPYRSISALRSAGAIFSMA